MANQRFVECPERAQRVEGQPSRPVFAEAVRLKSRGDREALAPVAEAAVEFINKGWIAQRSHSLV
jgi:hypothetical protein